MKKFKIYKAKPNDNLFVFKLYNFAVGKKFFKNKKKLSLEDHSKWYEFALKSKEIYIHICQFNNKPIGYIKYNLFRKNSAYISIVIKRNKEYKGLSSYYLKKSILIIYKRLKVKYYYAEVLKSNKISKKFFVKNMFRKSIINQKLSKIFNQKNLLYCYVYKK